MGQYSIDFVACLLGVVAKVKNWRHSVKKEAFLSFFK